MTRISREDMLVSSQSERKKTGAHFTPPALATFVARQIVSSLSGLDATKLRVMDPAVGDGALLDALLSEMAIKGLAAREVVGYDTNHKAIAEAEQRLSQRLASSAHLSLRGGDFLATIADSTIHGGEQPLFKQPTVEAADVVIANPPYVRTQQLGAAVARKLAEKFGLSGRVDLYHAFIEAIATNMSLGGIAGLIVPNRFMTTKAGASTRESLLSRFEILHVWDLGDTRIFNAAVLPSVLLLRRTNGETISNTSGFTSIYTFDAKDPTIRDAVEVDNVISALEHEGLVTVPGDDSYLVQHGTLHLAESRSAVWRLTSPEVDAWLDTVHRNTYTTLGEIANIRVGVKTTADAVFISSDWKAITGDELPELLRPLITHHVARRYKSLDPCKRILYTHEVRQGKRRAVDLEKYPNSAAYLERHRERLESRNYVLKANRNWFEIWVPQDPSAWMHPKLVFRDITEKPTFWLDLSGAVVNGDCYWIPFPLAKGVESELMYLALAVCNSTFIEKFYDTRFNNKLYAGRRRFITQYVEKFPLPDPKTDQAKRIVHLARQIYESPEAPYRERLEKDIDDLVHRAFGLPVEEVVG